MESGFEHANAIKVIQATLTLVHASVGLLVVDFVFDDIDDNACTNTSIPACPLGSRCVDLPPPSLTRVCECDTGFEADGEGCRDIDACATQPCGGNAACTDQSAPSLSRTCTCNDGYTGDPVLGCTG